MNGAPPALKSALARLNPRERILVASAAAMLLVAGLWSMGDWVALERERLTTSLPRAQADLARLQGDAALLNDLATRTTPNWPDLEAASAIVTAAAASADIPLEVERVGTARLRLRGSAPLSRVVSLLANLQSDVGLRTVKAKLEVEGNGVRFEIELAPTARR